MIETFFFVKALAGTVLTRVLKFRLIEPTFMCLYPYVARYPSLTTTSFVANHHPIFAFLCRQVLTFGDSFSNSVWTDVLC